ncbi:MAG: hypothetical protein M3094_10475 [Actinomycetia bacterium]|nr:hypothetical protein [Actinomycetes bacterium]
MSLLDKIHALNDEITQIDIDIDQARSELGMLEHLADDAARDAAVSENYEDRADARMTRSDVVRCEKRIGALHRERSKLLAKRDRMVARLAGG